MPPTIGCRVPLACSHCGHLDDARSIAPATSGLGAAPIDDEPGNDEQRLIAPAG